MRIAASLRRPFTAPPRWCAGAVFALAMLLGAVVLALRLPHRLSVTAGGVAAALPVIAVFGALVAVVIIAADRSHARVNSALAWAFAWGGVGATGIALYLNGVAGTAVIDGLGYPAGDRWAAALIGPLNEETIKIAGVALLLVMYRARIDRPLQAFAVGAFAGLGFQMVENLTYAATFALRDAQSDVAGALTVSITRGIVGFQSHWVYTGLFAAGLVLAGRRPGLAVAGGLLAYLLHGLWNAPGGENPLLVLAVLLAKCALTLTVLAAAWAAMLVEHRRWLRAAVRTPVAATLAPTPELIALPTRAERRALVTWMGHYRGPEFAAVAKQRQRWLLRELVYRAR